MIKTENYFQRELFQKIVSFLDRKEIFAIKGPRQSGKTTFLHIIKDYLIKEKNIKEKNILLFTFEDRDIVDKVKNDPKGFIEKYLQERGSDKVYFLIDEVQYLEDGGQKMKLFFDLFTPQAKFIITGSSSLELKNQTGKYLVGRVFSFHLWPLTFAEILNIDGELSLPYQEKHKQVYDFLLKGKSFKIPTVDIWQKDLKKKFEEYVIWGGYPEVAKTKNKEVKQLVLKNIYDTYINRDIVALLQLKSVENFRNVVKLLSSEIGNLINYNNLANDSKTYFQELKHHLSVLEETYIVEFLKPYFKNPANEIKKNPKVYFIDSGLRNLILNNFNSLETRNDKGALIENIVLSQLRRNAPEIAGPNINYWRTIIKAEVDFIVSTGQEIIPIEVKYGDFKKPVITRSFRSFLDQYKPKNALVLTKGFWGKVKIGKTIVKFAPVWYL